jgi:diguanylate cyclase (GGDEF)-like protein
MFIDLDGFKTVNDTLGHDIGDSLLRAAAQRMTAEVRESDTLARHGGDEFVLLAPEVNGAQDLTELANRLLEAFAEPFTVAGHTLHTTPSIGIACYPDDSSDANGLLRCADAAMYRAKLAGKNRFAFYHPE